MDNAYVSALAALAGSAIGAIASFATTWLTQHGQARAQRVAQAIARREHLYSEFIDELRYYSRMPYPMSSMIHQSLSAFMR